MAVSQLSNLSFALADPISTARGQKQIPLTQDGKPIVWQPCTPLRPVFEPSAFGDEAATRVTLVLEPSQEVVQQLESFDSQCKKALLEHSVKVFGTALPAEEIERRYQSPLKRLEKTGMLTLRVKMNLVGRSKVKCWDQFRKQREPPESWLACSVLPRLTIRCLWVMQKEIGALVELTDAMLDEQSAACPWGE